MGIIAIIAAVVLAGVLVFNSQEARPQPLPTQQETTVQQPDCGCGVPASPRGPR
jgi:hypothetical protein